MNWEDEDVIELYGLICRLFVFFIIEVNVWIVFFNVFVYMFFLDCVRCDVFVWINGIEMVVLLKVWIIFV